ncbi:MAG: hypothetical protein HKN27_17085 [Silicimonas sp.]|nr:hypothetical protein [Silicimonas sp.]
MKLNLYKPKKVLVSGESLILSGPFWSTTLRPKDVRSIEISRTLSLVDELGITLTADAKYFFTDGVGAFARIASILDFDGKFKSGWYARAERGENLVFEA